MISDLGNAWNTGVKLPDWIFTAGYEIKFAIKVGKIPLINFALGEAQTIEGSKGIRNTKRLISEKYDWAKIAILRN